jgi:hypothetical protein
MEGPAIQQRFRIADSFLKIFVENRKVSLAVIRKGLTTGFGK